MDDDGVGVRQAECTRYQLHQFCATLRSVATVYATLGEQAIAHAINETQSTTLVTTQELLPVIVVRTNSVQLGECGCRK